MGMEFTRAFSGKQPDVDDVMKVYSEGQDNQHRTKRYSEDYIKGLIDATTGKVSIEFVEDGVNIYDKYNTAITQRPSASGDGIVFENPSIGAGIGNHSSGGFLQLIE